MQSLFFWRNWDNQSKYLYLIVACMFFFAVGFFLFNLVLGADSILNWESFAQSYTIETGVASIKEYPFTVNVSADSILFLEYFGGSDIEINSLGYYLFLIIFCLSLCFLVTISTFLPRFWYFVSTGLFVVVLILMKLELLLLFGSAGKLGVIIGMLFYLPASYYFQVFNKSISFLKRFITFGILTLLYGLIIYLFADVQNPFMQLAVYSTTPALILTLIFVILVSHDIIAGFLNAVTSGGTGSKGNWKHFFVISGIYLLNVLLLYLNEVRIITWELLPINVFILLLISTLVGIWGYKQRESQYDYLIPFYPLGAIFYLCAASIAIGTVGYFYATGNDAILDVVEDVVIFSHLGYGFVFIMYILSNFLAMMTKNLPIYRILYTPDVMPYFTFRFAGLIAFGALLFLQNWEIPFQKSVAGYYNGLGDLYTENEEFLLANGYYKEASIYGRSDHRSNYALAQNAMSTRDFEKALKFYDRSNYSGATEYSYANLSNLYYAQGKVFEAMFETKKGLKKFPSSGPLLNNVGILYSKMQLYDSAYLYFNLALEHKESKEEAMSNIIALIADSPLETRELDNWIDRKNPINMSNYHAINSGWKEAPQFELSLNTNQVNQFSHTYIYNYLINNIWSPDTSVFEIIRPIQNENSFFSRRIDLAMAFNYYYKGDIMKAIDLLKSIRMGEISWVGKIDNLLGSWYLENQDMAQAMKYFGSAADNYYKDGPVNYAIAASLHGMKDLAIIQWDSIANTTDVENVKMAREMTRLLNAEESDILISSDDEKYQWMLFHPERENELIIQSFSEDKYRAKAYLDQAARLLKKDQPELCWEYLSIFDTLKVTDEQLKAEISSLSMEVAARLENTTYLASLLDAGFKPMDKDKLSFYYALLAESADDSVTAREIYEAVRGKNPFDEGMIIASSKFFEARGEKDKGYSILQEASSENLNSIALQKAYVGICGRMGYTSFGNYVIEKIKDRISEDEYERLITRFKNDISEFQEIPSF